MAQQTFNDTKINVEFEPTSNRQQLASGDALPTLFGKISKTMGDLKPVTFSGDYNDLENRIKEIELTQAEYDALGDEKLSDDVTYFIKDGSAVGWSGAIVLTEADYLANKEKYDASEDIYFIEDGGDGPFAKDMLYDNANSGLESTNVQDAVDEVKGEVDVLTGNFGGILLHSGGTVASVDIPDILSYKRFDVIVQNSSYAYPSQAFTMYPNLQTMMSIHYSYLAYSGTQQFSCGEIRIDTENNQLYVHSTRGFLINITTEKTITHASEGKNFNIIGVVGYK